MNKSSFEVLGVRRDATKEEIKQAYYRKMLKKSSTTELDGRYSMQLVREAYRDIMKGFGLCSHLALYCTREDVDTGVVCRCGSKYSLENIYENVIECVSCSCYVKIV